MAIADNFQIKYSHGSGTIYTKENTKDLISIYDIYRYLKEVWDIEEEEKDEPKPIDSNIENEL